MPAAHSRTILDPEIVRFSQVVVPMEIVLGVLIGFMMGVVLCAKFLRREIAGMVEPRLEHIEQQLYILREETNLDAATRLAALSKVLDERDRAGSR